MLTLYQNINEHLSYPLRQMGRHNILLFYFSIGCILIANGESTNTLENPGFDHLDCQNDLYELSIPNSTDTMSIEFINVRPHGCGIAINGAATATVIGGVAPYTYEWSTSPKQLGPRAIRLDPGTYTITATDNTGSQIIDSIEIVESPVPIQLDCPGPGLMQSCLSQNEIDTYLENWLTPFRNTESNYFNFTYDIDINGDVTTGIQDLNDIQLDSTIVGYMSVTMNIACGTSSDN